jgi:hypothetical protein
MEPDDHVEGYVGERGEKVGVEVRHLTRLGPQGFQPADALYTKQRAWRPRQAGSLSSNRKRAIDSREHFLFLENFEQMI